jgi:hypothetical protein
MDGARETVDAGIMRAIVPGCLVAAGSLMLMHQALAEVTCRQSAGPRESKIYVEQCLEVSPATHPPCNVENARSLIKDEIRRGCAMLGKDAPAFCVRYHDHG